MHLAIVADWLVTYGGAEHVLAEFRMLYPQAPMFTTVARRHALGPLNDADIRTTWLQRLYAAMKNHQVLLPLMPRAIESIDLQGYDVVLSSSHAVGKGIVAGPHTLHVCYCHTPMRYAWEMEDEYLHDFGVPKLLQGFVRRQLTKLRRWDLTNAKRVDLFIANSTTTQERIKRIYGRESIVIPPPVDDRFFGNSEQKTVDRRQWTEDSDKQNKEKTDHCSLATDYYLAVGRLVPYKRFDLLIDVANKLKLPLKIAGRGQDEARLKKLAGPTVEFLGFVSDEKLQELYANATALLFPQYEDAGIVLLEAQTSGTPVIAYRAGGAVDAMQEGTTGIFFDEQTAPSLKSAIEVFQSHTWDRTAIRNYAQKFSQKNFREQMKRTIEGAYEQFETGNFVRR